ncbi:MAG: Fic family protein [Microbacterium sp.]
MIPDFFTPRPQWAAQIEQIVELLGRVNALQERSGRVDELRRQHRIGSVQSSAAIEGNVLSVADVAAIAAGEHVIAPPRDVQEVKNLLDAYRAIDTLDPWDVDHFLHAHALVSFDLVQESGAFRTVPVYIVGPKDDLLHTGADSEAVPGLIRDLFAWGVASEHHPLIVASATHFMIEHIHPFRDGNGRIGRLWQTLILSSWRPELAWLQAETLIAERRQAYYDALQDSRKPVLDAKIFIDYMLSAITAALLTAEARARLIPPSGGINGGINEAVLAVLRLDPTLTASALSVRLGKGQRTVERALADLRAGGRLRREGSKKSGRWIVVEKES